MLFGCSFVVFFFSFILYDRIHVKWRWLSTKSKVECYILMLKLRKVCNIHSFAQAVPNEVIISSMRSLRPFVVLFFVWPISSSVILTVDNHFLFHINKEIKNYFTLKSLSHFARELRKVWKFSSVQLDAN